MTSWIAAAGAGLFVLVLLVDGWLRPGYSPVRHTVSALALGERGWVQTTSFVACGAAITVGAVELTTAGDLLLGAALALFGLGLVASGVFPMDSMRGYPPGTPDGDPPHVTRRHEWHDHAGAVVFLSLPAAAAVGAFVLPGLLWTITSAALAVGLTVGFGRFATAWENDSPRTGLVQRAVIVPGWLWVSAVFTHSALA